MGMDIIRLLFSLSLVLKESYVRAVDSEITIYLSDYTEAPPTISIIQGETLFLTCQSDIPGLSFMWGSSYSPTLRYKNNSLEIFNLRVDQAGNYTCNVFNDSLDIIVGTRYVTVDVLYSPSRVTVVGPTYSLDYENITLRCSSNGNPLPSYIWSDSEDGSLILHRGPTFNTVFDMSLFLYFCLATNTLFPTQGTAVTKSTGGSFEIEPQIKIEVYIDEAEYFVEEDSDITIECLTHGHPPPTVWWTRGFNDTLIATGTRLMIRNAQIEDLYTCYGVNTVTTAEGELITTTSTATTYVTITYEDSTTNDSPTFTDNTESTTFKATTTTTTTVNTLSDADTVCPELQTASSCSDTIIVALISGWIIAAILVIACPFYVIRVRRANKQPDWLRHHESFDQISVRPSVQYSQNQRNSAATVNSAIDYSGYRPHLPERPGPKGDEHDYSTLDGLQTRGSPDGSNPRKPTQDDDYLTPKTPESDAGDYVVPYSTVVDEPGTCMTGINTEPGTCMTGINTEPGFCMTGINTAGSIGYDNSQD